MLPTCLPGALDAIPQEPARARRLAAARTSFPEAVVERFERGMFQTDVLADRVIEEFALLPRGEGWRSLERGLATGHTELRTLADLLRPLQEPPAWFDAARVARGAQLWWRFFPANVIGLSGSLLLGYEHGDLVKPQALNGRTLELAGKRYEETGRWMYAATAPGGLVPGADGFAATIRIRVLHAVVRAQLRTRPEWDRVAYGEPIHSTGMSLTNLAFLLLPLRVGELLGMPFDDEEREALRQLWCWVGHLMGVPPEMLPTSIAWGLTFSRASHVILAPPDADSRALIDTALRGAIRAERLLPQPLWRLAAPRLRPLVSGLVYGSTRSILAGMNGAPHARPAREQLAVRVLAPWVRGREWARRRGLLGSDAHIAARQRAAYERTLKRLSAAEHPLHPRDADLAHDRSAP